LGTDRQVAGVRQTSYGPALVSIDSTPLPLRSHGGRIRDDAGDVRCRPKIRAWLARRPHYHVRFTPTSASWINQVERWFAELTRKRLRRGVHTSVRQLEADIRSFIDRHNQNPRPFKWTKSADQILASVKRSSASNPTSWEAAASIFPW
jgi:transposase